MLNIIIKNSNELTTLASILNVSENEVESSIFNFMNEEWDMLDEMGCVGKTMSEVIVNQGSHVSGFALLALNTRDRQAIELLSKLFVIHRSEDCEVCGYHTEKTTDGLGKEQWEESECLNPNCGHKTSSEPLTNYAFEDE